MIHQARALEARSTTSQPSICFCAARGASIAYSAHGRGPTVVMAPLLVNHLERDLDQPQQRIFYQRLAERSMLVRYDRSGTGLSDRARTDFSFERELAELDAVVRAQRAPSVALVGSSFGSPLAIAYAALHPHRVSRLVLDGSFAFGGALAAPAVQQALVSLVRASFRWGAETLTAMMAPRVSSEEARRFAQSQLSSTTPEVAAELLSTFFSVDVRHLARQVTAPTLVVHRRHDEMVPFEAGRDVAALIPSARLLSTDGTAHLPWWASEDVAQSVADFLAEAPPTAPATDAPPGDGELTRCGDVWAISYAGRRFHLKHAKGLSDLATLVRSPGIPIAATVLADGAGERVGSGVAMAAPGAERARKAVQARLRDAILRISELAPELGDHLERSIATGLYCVYNPALPLRWRVETSRAA